MLGMSNEGEHLPVPVSRGVGVTALCLFAMLLVGLPAFVGYGQGVAVFDSFFRSGALVFGGGHVVLPLLEAEVVQPGWVAADEFLAGYGAAQAVPGPLFTFGQSLRSPTVDSHRLRLPIGDPN